MSTFELNIDGLVGPTHHYAGLAKGNIASTTNAFRIANPKAAAHQGIAKMRYLHQLGIKQALLPPHARPHLDLLRQLGFTGTPEQQLHAAFKASPKILMACYSASSMWTANCATVSPSRDSQDNRLHFTPANLISQLHRHQEADFSSLLLQRIFANPQYFVHHSPLPKAYTISDEGAANHNRICAAHGQQGLHLFVYGRIALDDKNTANPTQFPARQTLEASQAIARLHQLKPQHVIFARQNPIAIDQGVFHHDVIGVVNESLILIHEEAFCQQQHILNQIQASVDYPLQILQVSTDIFSIKDAVESYIFNSQIVTLPGESKQMLLIAPHECEVHPRIKPWIDEVLSHSAYPIQKVHYFDLKQSMQNGGGPACLRLRVPMNAAELQAMHQGILMDDEKLDTIDRWIDRHYRDRLEIHDLLDPMLIQETQQALDELTQILDLGSLYSFQ